MGKTALSMPDGYDVYSGLEALREHFDLKTVVKYYRSGELVTWMEERYYDDLADALEKLNPNAPDMERKLCAILGVVTEDDNDDKRTEEKLALLKEKTDDESILANAAITAFTQEDLAKILDAGKDVIYLCGEATFSIPTRKTGKKYIGILGTPKISVRVSTLGELEDRGIILENLELPRSLSESTGQVAASDIGARKTLDKEQLLALFQAVFAEHLERLEKRMW